MQLTGPEQLRQRLADLSAQLGALIEERRSADERYYSGRRGGEGALDQQRAALEAAQAEELAAQRRRLALQAERVAERGRRHTERLAEAHQRLRGPLLVRQREESERVQRKRDQAREQAAARTQAKLDRLESEHEQAQAGFAALRELADGLRARVEALAATTGARLPPIDPARPAGGLQEPLPFQAALREQLERMAGAFARLERSRAARMARRSSGATSALGVLLLAGAAAGALLYLRRPAIELGAAGGLAGVALLVVLGSWRGARRRLAARAAAFHGDAHQALAHIARQEELAKERHWARYKSLLERRVEKTSAAEQQIEERTGARSAGVERALEQQKRRLRRAEQRLAARNERAARRLEQEERDATSALEASHAAQREELAGERQRAGQAAEADRAACYRRTAAAWDAALTALREEARVASDRAHAAQPAWEALAAPDARWPAATPSTLPIGRIELPLDALVVPEDDELKLPPEAIELPLELAFPETGSLLIQAGPERREQALELLFGTALRVLAGFPPGMARLTIVDPVGLGQNFSALMELADHDEALIGGRIWTDASHIEKRLAELTEQMEKVIQKYLRNTYATIGEYNAGAGEMQEAYEFLLLADLPAGLSDLALDRLASIASSGAPCGVHLLMHHDAKQPWPRQLDRSLFLRGGIVLEAGPAGFAPAHEGLKRCRFAADPPPPVPQVTRLLAALGARALDARKVELSFAAAAPQELWQRSSEKGITVPIGRSGATRLQELDLGRGTAQHALIAGKTGSGKSTLFHVMITCSALWYSPREVEFYLIDFKKGVEFKVYATHGLPHARVIAIESDREFGLAVLQRLDEELDRRGDLFRGAGVQDLAAYRRTPGALPVPRTMLLIDEFQEFFTEDDTVSHEASLLLDRFVRQGRAFGVHLILGSQTLSGVYTLAKSTLGQVGIRIALQCNETDSYLILGEDNAAARLLSRPGEAIYNAMSGLVEGNNPFQVVWLPDELQADYLTRIARRAEQGDQPAPRPIVFESNAPARLEHNELLRERLAAAPAGAPPTISIWLGEPNAIKGPTEARFAPTGGSNLLIVGQRKESAYGMACAGALALASGLPAGSLRLLVLDGSGPEERYADDLERVARVVPATELVPYRDAAERIAEIAEQIAAAQEAGSPPALFTFLFVLGLQRFRALREEDEYASFGRDEPASSGAQFATILRDGPEQHVHAVVWCDTLANASRALSRRSLREFDQRVLFQMSAADSAELIDSPRANTLGLINALLHVESEGRIEKFRPYALPDAEWLESLSACGRGPSAAASC